MHCLFQYINDWMQGGAYWIAFIMNDSLWKRESPLCPCLWIIQTAYFQSNAFSSFNYYFFMWNVWISQSCLRCIWSMIGTNSLIIMENIRENEKSLNISCSCWLFCVELLDSVCTFPVHILDNMLVVQHRLKPVNFSVSKSFLCWCALVFLRSLSLKWKSVCNI